MRSFLAMVTLGLLGGPVFGLLCAQGAPESERIRDLIRKAQTAEQAEKLDLAAATYREILTLRPHWVSAEFNLALVYHSQKKYPEAIQLLDEVLRHDPSLADAYLFRGAAYYYTDQLEKALPSLERFLQLKPESPEVRTLLAGTYSGLDNQREAARMYLGQIQLTPGNGELYYYLGQCYLDLARAEVDELAEDKKSALFYALIQAEQAASDDLAESMIRNVIRSQPGFIEAYLSLGRNLLARGKAVAARESFAEAAAKDPTDCRSWEGIADSELAAGRYRPALEAAGRALRSFPACFEAPPVRHLGLQPSEFAGRSEHLKTFAAGATGPAAQHLLGRYQSAYWGKPEMAPEPPFRKACEAAVSGRTFAAEATRLLVLASCHAARRELGPATTALIRAQKRAPEDPKIHYWSLRIWVRLAEVATVKLASVTPGSPLLVKLRAQNLEQAGRQDEAEAEYRKAIALAPSDADPLIEFAKFKCRLGQFDEALPALEKALALDSYNIRVQAQIGEVRMMQDQPQKAMPYLRAAVKANPRDRRSRMYLARALADAGQLGDAIRLLEAVGSDPDGRAHYLLGRLYSQQGEKERAARAFAVFRERKKALSAGSIPAPDGRVQ